MRQYSLTNLYPPKLVLIDSSDDITSIDFDTIQEAVAAAGKWGFIIDTTTDEDITIKAKEGTYNE